MNVHLQMTALPMTELGRQEHEAEQIRQQAWDVFVASMRDEANAWGWDTVVLTLADVYAGRFRDIDVRETEIAQFAAGYGWPDTLRAVAAAMQADEQFKRQAEARR